MKKAKRNIILSSLLAIGFCASLVTGATYALFTSQSEVNVAVTSGKIDVVAKATEPSYGSTLPGGKLDESSATVANNTVTIDKMVPGDVVEFDLIIKNNSNVKVQYRTVIKKVADDGLWKGLEITIGGKTYDGITKITEWQQLSPNSADEIIHVKVTLPKGRGIEYANKTCQFTYSVEAVQGNASVSNPIVSAPESQTELNEALANQAASDVYLELDKGTYTLPAVSNKNVQVIGSGADTTKIDMTSSSMIGAQNGGLDISFEDVTVSFSNENYKGITHSSKVTYKDCTLVGKQFLYASDVEFENCTFINDDDYTVWTYGSSNASFKNCTFKTGGKAILIYCEDATHTNNVIVEDCVFYDNDNLKTKKAAIEIGDSQPIAGLKVNLIAKNNKIYGFAINDEGTGTGNKVWGNKNDIPTDRLTVVTSNNQEFDNVVASSGNSSVVSNTLKSEAKDITIYLTDDVVISGDSATQLKNASGGVNTDTIVIDGQGHTLDFKHIDSDANHIATNGAKLILKNLHLTNSGYNDGPWNRHDIVFDCDVELENVTSDKAIALGKNAKLTNVTITDVGEVYGLWIKATASKVELDNVTINCSDAGGRAICIKDEYISEGERVAVELSIKDSKLISSKKAGILVTNTAGATIIAENVDITEVKADSTNLVWIDEKRPNSVVTVTGATVIPEP